MAANAFGRVDSENNVFVQDQGTERRVGQFPNVTPEEALGFYERKFADLEAQVRIAEQRVAAKLDAHLLKKSILKLHTELVEPAVVGDIADLRTRVDALDAKVAELETAKHEQTKEQVAEGLAAREAIAAKAEAIAAQDVAKTMWKNSSAEMAELFTAWQTLQKSGAKVPKSEADVIWKRFSSARTKFENAKRAHFAALDAANKQTKGKKLELVTQAENLAAKGAEAAAEYRKLLDQWKLAGRSSSKTDDQLWARFKVAGDAIYAAKSEAIAIENVEFSKNLEEKLALLKEAKEQIKPESDLANAKRALGALQAKWEKIGKVPREKVREVEDKLRAIETSVRKAEEEEWRKNDPATQDRTNSVLSQLEESISKLESDLKAAEAKKDAKGVKAAKEALEARTAWLKVVKAAG